MDPKITLDQIREVVRDEVRTSVKEELQKELVPIHKTLNGIGEIIDEKLQKELKPVNKTLKKIQKDLKDTFIFADKNYLEHESRLRKVESRLQLTDSL